VGCQTKVFIRNTGIAFAFGIGLYLIQFWFGILPNVDQKSDRIETLSEKVKLIATSDSPIAVQRFAILNRSNRDVTIVGADGPCKCVSIPTLPVHIRSGETKELQVVFDCSEYTNSFSTTSDVTLLSTDLDITGKVPIELAYDELRTSAIRTESFEPIPDSLAN
jgi:hypothetical protein